MQNAATELGILGAAGWAGFSYGEYASALIASRSPDWVDLGVVTLFLVGGAAIAATLIDGIGEPKWLSPTRRVRPWTPMIRLVLRTLWFVSGSKTDVDSDVVRDVAREPVQRVFVLAVIVIAALAGALSYQHARKRLAEYGLAQRAADPIEYIIAEAIAGRDAPCSYIDSGTTARDYCKKARNLRSRVTPEAQALAREGLLLDLELAGFNMQALRQYLAKMPREPRD